MQYKSILKYLLSAAIGAFIMYLYLRPSDSIITTPVVSDIVKETKEAVAPLQVKIDSFKIIDKVIADKVKPLEKKLYAAQQEVKRLASLNFNNKEEIQRENSKTIQREFTDSYSEIPNSSNGNATDYTEIFQAATTSDSLCNEVIALKDSQLIAKENIITYQDLKATALQNGFEDMTKAALQKDAAIKSLNKKLKWVKVQNVGLKAAVLAGAFFILKNNLK